MPRGGYRPGAGRPKGTPDKGTASAVKVLHAGGSGKRFQSALEYAMDVINDPAADPDAKVRLAIAAMPFQHAKLEAIPADKGGKKQERQDSAERASTGGRYGVPAAPGARMN